MSRKSFWTAVVLTFMVGVLVGIGLTREGQAVWGSEMLPRFTEAREAAARHFVKKNLPELLPVLDKLKMTAPDKYQQEIRSVYQVTEMLAELDEDPPRQELELKVWVTENKAQVLLAKLATPQEDERKKIQAQLQDLSKELVKLDIQILALQAEQLEQQLSDVKAETTRLRTNQDKLAKDRFDSLLQRMGKRSK